jgi:hypothetical protein
MAYPQDNFISQNFIVNRGAYNVFGQRVNERLGEYYEAYQKECAERENSRESNRIPICNCRNPFPRDPDAPFLVYRVRKIMPATNYGGKYLETEFADRPEKLAVQVVFYKNSQLAYSTEYQNLPQIASTTVEFSNYIDFQGANLQRYQKRGNYYKFHTNRAGIRTTSLGFPRSVPLGSQDF